MQGVRRMALQARCSERFRMVFLIPSCSCTAGVPAEESHAALLPGTARVGGANKHRVGCACGASKAEPDQEALQAGRGEGGDT